MADSQRLASDNPENRGAMGGSECNACGSRDDSHTGRYSHNTRSSQDARVSKRLAYADPPYPGQSAQWYGEHADFAGEVDHADLIATLERDYDGWALSTSSLALPYVLSLCPTDPPAPGFTAALVGGVRVASWHRGKPAPRGTSRVMVTWEPVVVRGGRQLAAEMPGYVWDTWQGVPYLPGERDGFAGSKPPGFARWIFDLLGATSDDTLTDLFPGTGGIGRAWEAFSAQTRLAV